MNLTFHAEVMGFFKITNLHHRSEYYKARQLLFCLKPRISSAWLMVRSYSAIAKRKRII